MKIAFFLLGLCVPCIAIGQTSWRSLAIQAEVNRTNRFAVSDLDHDGWDDLWTQFFPKIDRNRIDLDEDGDGKSNYQEMLDFGDPYAPNKSAIQTSPEEVRAEVIRDNNARIASDRAKLERFIAIVEERNRRRHIRDAEVQVAISVPREPVGQSIEGSASSIPAENRSPQPSFSSICPEQLRILCLERLSNGQTLLAWEGPGDRTYSVEYSEDLVHWTASDWTLPVVAGLGYWGQSSAMSARFFRVNTGVTPTTPSAEDGGDGTSTFGGLLTVGTENGLMIANVTVNIPASAPTPVVELYIDGERYGYCTPSQGGNYASSISGEDITAGTHVAHAVITSCCETTPGPDDPWIDVPGILRTPGTTFQNYLQEDGYITGFRATEPEIDPDDPDLPDATTFLAEVPYLESAGADPGPSYSLEIQDENGVTVREFSGSFPGPGPNQLAVEWDGNGEGGVTLPPGRYSASLLVTGLGALWSVNASPSVQVKEPPNTVLALGERLGAASDWGEEQLASYYPAWWMYYDTSAGPRHTENGWGPWRALGHGTMGTIKNLIGTKKAPWSKWRVKFWVSGESQSNARPWAGTATTPAGDFETGNPFNDYDIGCIFGHGVASTSGITRPPQHYFPFVKNPSTGETVWLESGRMARKFGATGKLKWMFVFTCNYFRVGDHNDGSIDIYAQMKQAGNLPFGDNLHVLCSYTTSIDIDGAMGKALAEGLHQVAPEPNNERPKTVVQSWNYAWQKSSNSKAVDGKGQPKQIRNARSVYWPECKFDTIQGVRENSVTTPQTHQAQTDLEETDSYFQ